TQFNTRNYLSRSTVGRTSVCEGLQPDCRGWYPLHQVRLKPHGGHANSRMSRKTRDRRNLSLTWSSQFWHRFSTPWQPGRAWSSWLGTEAPKPGSTGLPAARGRRYRPEVRPAAARLDTSLRTPAAWRAPDRFAR